MRAVDIDTAAATAHNRRELRWDAAEVSGHGPSRHPYGDTA